MKRILTICVLLLGLTLMGCKSRNTLHVLNWGEYINEDMVARFEEEYGVDVKIDIAESNEAMYQKIINKTTAYDIVIPSDYMIQKMHAEDLLHEIDLAKLTNYKAEDFMPGVYSIVTNLFEGSDKYAIPYFWGAWGLIYNTKVAGLEDAVNQYGLKTIFETDKVPAGTRIGMYDVPRYAYATALIYKGLDPNLATAEALSTAQEALSMHSFYEWGTDTLKHNIGANNLDLAFTWTGDFFDVLYAKQAAGTSLENMPIGMVIPQETMGFMDAMVIPSNATNVEVAHQFINFFLDPEISYNNASIIGYTTPLITTYDRIIADPDTDWAQAVLNYPYMPAESVHAPSLSDLGDTFVSNITLMVNNVKTR